MFLPDDVSRLSEGLLAWFENQTQDPEETGPLNEDIEPEVMRGTRTQLSREDQPHLGKGQKKLPVRQAH